MEINETTAKTFWRQRGVPEDALEDLWDMSKAVRHGDAKVEEWSGEKGEGVVKLLTELGWHSEAVLYMADQRVGRVILLHREGLAALRRFTAQNQPMVMSQDVHAQTILMSTWMDGFACALGAEDERNRREDKT